MTGAALVAVVPSSDVAWARSVRAATPLAGACERPSADGPAGEDDATSACPVTAASCSDAGPAPVDPSVPASSRILGELDRIMARMSKTSYSHRTRVDERQGSYELDCSGLLAVVLRAAAPDALDAVPVEKGQSRPRAYQFHAAFDASPASVASRTGWRRVASLAETRRGDVIAWRVAEIPKKGNTGHVVVVAADPVREPSDEWRVRVVDSTSRGHGGDPRRPGRTGIGTGTMWFRGDRSGAPVGYRWDSPTGILKTAPIAIGRPIDATRCEEPVRACFAAD